jgi:5-(carboxyamino)imidazole ribonucleotide synthase
MPAASFPLAPGAVIGVLGGGQLGRMLALAAARLGFDTVILTPRQDAPASRVAAHTIHAAYDDPDGLAELARLCAVVTYEFENVPAAAVDRLAALGCPVAPGPRALAVAQDRIAEKSFFEKIGVPTVAFAPIDSAADIAPAMARLGAPALLKTRREGYDGKGQAWVNGPEEAGDAFARIGAHPAILEARAPFVRELSVIAARGRDGTTAAYPAADNHHDAGILRRSYAPADLRAETAAAARVIAVKLLDELDYVGVIGVELFELEGGELMVNEFAPRVHNSGHWTLDGCEVDQFEQHIRAVAGWPLGPTDPLAAVEMINLLGEEADGWADLAADPSARIWLYGKHETGPGRKMGHVNRLRPLKGPLA